MLGLIFIYTAWNVRKYRVFWHSASYENLIIVGDVNVCLEKSSMSGFCDTCGLKSLLKDATCYKNPKNPRSIDLILKNNPSSFQDSCVIEAVLLDFHRMVVTIMKTSSEWLKPRVINYRENFSKKIISRTIVIWIIKCNFRGKC